MTERKYGEKKYACFLFCFFQIMHLQPGSCFMNILFDDKLAWSNIVYMFEKFW